MLRTFASRAVRQARGFNAPHVTSRAMSTAVMSEDQIAEEWSKVTAAPVSDEAKRSLALLQKKLNEARDAGAAQTSSKPVDWAGLKAKSPHPDIVDQYEAVHASHAFKSWDGVWEGKDVVKESAAEFAKFAAEARAVADNATKELESINQKLAELEAQQEKLSTITLEEVFKEDPKLMEETHARVRKGEWYAD